MNFGYRIFNFGRDYRGQLLVFQGNGASLKLMSALAAHVKMVPVAMIVLAVFFANVRLVLQVICVRLVSYLPFVLYIL